MNKYTKNIILYFVVFIIFVVSLIIIIFKIDYYTYYNGTFFLDGDNYSVVVNSFDISKVINNKYLLSENMEYEYKILNVSEIFLEGTAYFQKVTIEIAIDKNIKLFNANIITSKKKIFWYIVDYLKGEGK